MNEAAWQALLIKRSADNDDGGKASLCRFSFRTGSQREYWVDESQRAADEQTAQHTDQLAYSSNQ